MPRLSEPGPLGMRAEHWYNFGSLAGNSNLFVQVVAHKAAAAVVPIQCYSTSRLDPPYASRSHVSVVLSTPQTWRTWSGRCSSATCSGAMACLAIGHSHINGNNPVTRHRYTFQHCTTTQSPTCPTSKNTFTTHEQASFPPQTTWCCTSPKNTQKKQVSTFQRNLHKQIFASLTDTPVERSVLLSQSTSHTGAHLMQPGSEAYEAEDRCFRVAVAKTLMRPHPAAPNAADVAQPCPNKSAAGLLCNKPVDRQHHCYGCRYRGGVDRRRAAVARCPADVTHSHSGTEVFIEQEVPALTRVVNGQRDHARMDLVFFLNGSATYLDVSIVAPFSCNPSLVAAASTRPGHTAKRAEKTKFGIYPHINIVPFILETTGRPGPHARKFTGNLLRDADNPPLSISDTWSAIQSVLHSALS